MAYYMIIDGRQAGPYSREDLAAQNLRPETMVWREGLDNWIEASRLPELADILVVEGPCSCCSQGRPGARQASFTSGYGARQPYGQPYPPRQPNYGAPIPHTNWLPWAIVATVLGLCSLAMVCGIIGIVYSNKANSLYNMGLRQPADDANTTARVWTIVGLVLVGVSMVSSILLFTVGGLSEIIASIN